jgi:ribose 5-phosphate isomerase B
MNAQHAEIALGCDHGAYRLKETIKAYLQDRTIDVADMGTHSAASVDYVDFGRQVAAAVSEGRAPRGILLCGTGLGMSMVANKFPRVRAALCTGVFAAALSRRHNDANILVLGGRVTGDGLALEIVRIWLETPFEGGRHLGRIEKFDRLEDLLTWPSPGGGSNGGPS